MHPALFIIWTLLILAAIVWVCELFTNAVEWVGHRFKLSDGAVGSVLAAVGTALPETMIPLVAIISAELGWSKISIEASDEIGIGAILGAPFLLSTLALFVMGIALLVCKRLKRRDSLEMNLDHHLSRRDLQFFFVAYTIAIGASFVPVFWIRAVLAGCLLLLYGYYVYKTMTIEHVPDEEFIMPDLAFAPKAYEPSTAIILTQVGVTTLGIIGLAYLFVQQVNTLSEWLHIPSLILSLLITPIATELPEKYNSVTWIAKGKDNLAMGNVTGAMVFQSCIPAAIGMVLTPWILNESALVSMGLCMISSAFLYFMAFQRWATGMWALLAGGLFYAIFIVYVLQKLLVVSG